MISKQIIHKIEREARGYFKKASGCHDWTHVERVLALASRIGEKEKADLDVIRIAALLHDIGRKEEMKCKGMFCHAEESKKISEKMLKKYNIFEDKITNILHCIVSHRYRNSHKPVTIEAKVLYDSDNLDSIGAVGIARVFIFAGSAGSSALYTCNEKKISKIKKDYSYTEEDSAILEYEIKLKYIKNKMITREGKRIARERHKYMKDYFKRFWLEVQAKK